MIEPRMTRADAVEFLDEAMAKLRPRAAADSEEQITGEFEAYGILETARQSVIDAELAALEPKYDTWAEHRGEV